MAQKEEKGERLFLEWFGKSWLIQIPVGVCDTRHAYSHRDVSLKLVFRRLFILVFRQFLVSTCFYPEQIANESLVDTSRHLTKTPDIHMAIKVSGQELNPTSSISRSSPTYLISTCLGIGKCDGSVDTSRRLIKTPDMHIAIKVSGQELKPTSSSSWLCC